MIVNQDQKREIPSLDGLRAVSILMVVISHVAVGIYYEYGSEFGRWASVSQLLFLVGHLGVTVFFVISGFLITSILLRDEKINLSTFYFRRTLRIFPPYYAYLGVIFALTLFGILDCSAFNTLAAFTYTRNYLFDNSANDSWFHAHTWSLAVEEQFYLIFPILLRIFGLRAGPKIAYFAILLCPLFRLWYLVADPSLSIEFNRFETVADSLAFGCLLAYKRDKLHESKFYQKVIGSKLIVVAPVAALVITWLGQFSNYYNKPVYGLIAFTIQNLCIFLAIDWAVTNPRSAIGSLLNWSPIASIGLISYSIYLWQQPFLDPTWRFPIILKLMLVMIASLCSYFFVEKTALRVRHMLEARLKTQ